ncbi:dihydroorotate dehydrogenase [Coprinellus micaceus]|uniref:Dihydroorotate dehydrogenase (quinone), mitochondrial n=1 Tax=Coprinellus micaceus TaxID=71717 RepID=A0A4Y7TST4_COPMI|nr:dihydroorotate dehydrogenase [Coprinellus micaceus]
MSLIQRSSVRLLARRPPLTSLGRPTSTRFASTQANTSSARNLLYGAAFAAGLGLFSIYYLDSRSALHRYILTPTLRALVDAETGHKIAVKALKYGVAAKDEGEDDAVIHSEIWGEAVDNPIGMAAGFDKDGEAIDGLFDLGFSWVEIGSVTPKPQAGNPKPRVFRLEEDNAIINRYGFPSQGAAFVLQRLRERLPSWGTTPERASLRPGDILAVNLGKNKDSPADSIEDFVSGVKTFGPLSDVLVINVSSPNTPGLRGLQNKDHLEVLLAGVRKARDELPPSPITSRQPKLVLKLAPDLDEDQLIDIADVVQKAKIDGVIVSNTTIQRPKHLISANKQEVGGLSGTPVKPYSLKALKTLRQHLPASIPLIGCGGISTGADALEFAKAGASLVQLYTSFGYEGVGAPRRIKDELVDELKKEGKTWSQVVNEALNELSAKPSPLNEPVKKGEEAAEQLVKEAEYLKELLAGAGKEVGGVAKGVGAPIPEPVAEAEIQASGINA